MQAQDIIQHVQQIRTLLESPAEAINEELILQRLYFPILSERYGEVARAIPKTLEWIFKDSNTHDSEQEGAIAFSNWLRSGSGISIFLASLGRASRHS
jgi:hypothetical protein